MNSSGLANNAIPDSALGRIDALRALAGVPTGVGEVSAVDDNPLAAAASDGGAHMPHQNHGAQHNQHNHLPHHLQHLQHQQHHNHNHAHHQGGYPPVAGPSMVAYQDSKLSDSVAKVENEVSTLNQDMAYFRHVLDFQNLKIEKLTLLLIDLLHNKDVLSIVSLLQSIQQSDPFNVDDTHDSVDDSVPDGVHDSVHDSVHDVAAALPSLQSPGVVSGVQVPGALNVSGVLLDSNMDPQLPQLHQVAQAAVAQAKNDGKKKRKRPFVKVNGNLAGAGGMAKVQQQQFHLQQQHLQQQAQQAQQQQNSVQQSLRQPTMQLEQQQQQQQGHTAKSPMPGVSMPGLEVVNVDNMSGRKKPNVSINFLHNPMTIKDIYDEFTKGFQGQPPLRELDERFGKYLWRGDSRSKESKRFQRRKKLCDAIERGMEKYGKSAEEIMRYIETFRDDRSLTWVMNGNLPQDLLE